VNRRLEIYRRPIRDKTQLYGFRYADMTVLRPADHATSLAAPESRIRIANLLP
jgi:hypothetical protein